MPTMEERGLTVVRDDIAALDRKLDQRFMWLMGIQLANLLAIVAGMFAIVAALIVKVP